MLSLIKPTSIVWLLIAMVIQTIAALGSFYYLVPTLDAQFANPEALTYLLLVPLCELLAIGYALWRRAAHMRLGESAMIEAMTTSRSARRQRARAALLIGALALFVIALAQPQWGRIERPVKRTGVDVVFALDLSSSMLARDIAPDRLQAAKQEITTTLELLGGDRVGLVVFTAVSFAQSPLTTDYGALRFYLRKLRPGQMPVGGTSVGLALGDAIELLTGKRGASDDEASPGDPVAPSQRAKTQVVVLITDGEDHESDPLGVAKRAKEHGIHVVTVGFGSTQGSRIPIMRDDGTLAGYKRDPDGEIVYTRLDDTTLREISTTTGGIYVPYEGKNSVANALIRYINSLEKSELETLLRQRYQDRFMWFLFPGVLLLLASMFLGERARPRRLKIASGAALVALALGSSGCQESFRGEVDEVADGNSAVAEERFDDALVSYERAQSAIPTTPELQFDLGVAHLGAGDHELAREAFARAIDTDDPTLHFDSLHNLGLALAGEEKWREAYETYQSALTLWALHPELMGQDRRLAASRNLEVVFQRLYPPCVKLEDDLEDNDTAETASTPEDISAVKDRTLCGLDDDWFAIPALAGAQVTVSATFETLRDDPDPERAFLPNPEDLQIALFDGAGAKVVSIDQGFAQADAPTDTKKKPGAKKTQRVTRALATVLVTEEMLMGTGKLLLKVAAADELEFSYDLEIDTVPPCSALDDEHEDNDTRADAKLLKAGAHQLHVCSEDEDWFAVDVELGDTLFVDLQGAPAEEGVDPPELTLEIRDAKGRVLETGRPESGVLTAGIWDVVEPGTFYIRVAGVDPAQEGAYGLELFQYAPCPAGDDRLEDNDTAPQARELDASAPMHRYLRLCPNDADYYTLALEPTNPPAKDAKDPKAAPTVPGVPAPQTKKEEEGPWRLALGLAVVRKPGAPDPLTTPAPIRDEDPDAPMEDLFDNGLSGPIDDPFTAPLAFDLLSPSGDQILLSAIPPAPEEPTSDDQEKQKTKKKKDDGSDAPADEEAAQKPIALDRILGSDELTQPTALVRVQGRPLFYHLVQLNPPESQQDQQDQQDEPEDQEGDDQEKPEDGEQDDKEQGEQGEQGEQDEPEDSEGDQGEEGDEGEQGEPKQPEDSEGDQGEKKPEEADSGEEGAQQDPEAQRVEDILRALEDTDDNFQMRKALKNAPRRYIQKDW